MADPASIATLLPDPVLAIDGGTVGVIVFLTISFISWIMNTIQAAQAKQKAQERRLRQQQGGGEAPRGQAGRQGDRVKSEIESFLEEVTGQKQAPAQQRPRPRAQQRPRRQPPRPPKPPQKQTRPPVPLTSSTSKPRELSSVRDHVSTYMSNRIEEHVEQDIGAHVDQHIDSHVQDHIGRETATDDHIRARRVAHPEASAIRDMLRNKAGVRRAILVSEILTRRTFKR